jgi:RsiW-degrading membrane proteinase PrsW (M82 family)
MLLAFVPVLLFLVELRLLDSYKLVSRPALIRSIAWGAAAALVCLAVHPWLLTSGLAERQTAGRYVAPVTEETLKALWVAILIARRRIGFPVDALIHGFAVGTGFAVVENAVYLRSLAGESTVFWMVRGFGTAVLHGATTAIFAMISRTRLASDRVSPALACLPGWLAAVLMHAMFNRAWVSPVAMTLALFLAAPALVLLVYRHSERATREWLGPGLDVDVALLDLLRSDRFDQTRIGRYLQELRDHFPAPSVADMVCLLRLRIELSIQAKSLLLAREAGLELMPDADLEESLAELTCLNHSIGFTGRLVLEPLRVNSGCDDWHHHLLTERHVSGMRWPGALRRWRASRLQDRPQAPPES